MAESELTTIARPYARAAFSQALSEPNGLDTWSRELGLLAATVAESKVRASLDNPRFTTAQESGLVIELMGEELNEKGQNFVTVLANYGRLSLLPEINRMYQQLKAKHEKTMDIDIVSAFEVDDAEVKVLADALAKRLQCDVSLTATVDNTLVGGVLIRAEDTVIDNSVRGKLNKLAQALH